MTRVVHGGPRGDRVRGRVGPAEANGIMRRVPLSSFVLALVACVGCDHASKHAAGLLLAGGDRIALASDTVRLELVSNPGAFLSLGAGLPEPLRNAVLVGLVPVLLATVIVCFWRPDHRARRDLVALGLVAGGGLGNWLDRLLHAGAVTDFVSVGLGRFRTGVFNLADLAIVAGVMLLVLARRGGRASGEGTV